MLKFDINKKPFSAEDIAEGLTAFRKESDDLNLRSLKMGKFIGVIKGIIFLVSLALTAEILSIVKFESSFLECSTLISGLFDTSFCYNLWNYGYIFLGLVLAIVVADQRRYGLSLEISSIFVRESFLMPLSEEGNLKSYQYLKDVADKYPRVKRYLKSLDRKPIIEELNGIKLWEKTEKERLKFLRQEALKNKPLKKDEATLAKEILINITNFKEA